MENEWKKPFFLLLSFKNINFPFFSVHVQHSYRVRQYNLNISQGDATKQTSIYFFFHEKQRNSFFLVLIFLGLFFQAINCHQIKECLDLTSYISPHSHRTESEWAYFFRPFLKHIISCEMNNERQKQLKKFTVLIMTRGTFSIQTQDINLCEAL